MVKNINLIYMKKVTIYGERCSGTNYLEQLLLQNFDIEIVWAYGWKHFFGFNNLDNTDDVLFIGIIRNIVDWINSLYREKHHLPPEITANIDSFLTNSFYSFRNDSKNQLTTDEIMTDRHIETNERYKNIFESRYVKNKFLVDTMPKLVKNYCLITYDDLCDKFIDIMNKLKDCGLNIRDNIEFPQNVLYYKANKNAIFNKKNNEIPTKIIMEKLITNEELLVYEKLLFPNMSFSL